jgi:RNA polymerase sigma factor (sigma-70 family)
MAHVGTGAVARHLETLFERGSVAGLSDRQLLERYTAGARDPAGEAAFAALVGRHGPMVLGVCRQLLGDAHHAEDAFQAVFLILARKAGSIRDPDLLGNWLYGVANRTARCARRQFTRRRRREERVAMKGRSAGSGAGSCAPVEPTVPPADRPVIDREQAEAIHDEVNRLPRAFRLPVVLCCFEGLSLDEAARRLRCPAGTLHSRLARAREKLRIRLKRRGVVLPAALVTAALAPGYVSASISPLLCDSTTRSAIQFAASHATAGGAISAPAAALAQEVLRTMLLHKIRLTAMSVVLLAAVATGAGSLTQLLGMKHEPLKTPAGQEARPATGSDRPAQALVPGPGRMFVTGVVLDPTGKPVARASVEIIGRPRRPVLDSDEISDRLVLMGHGVTDAEGRFQLDAPRSSSIRFFAAYALAAAPGFGLAWVDLNADAEQPAAEMGLVPEQMIRGRLVDITGQPVTGAELQLVIVGRPRNDRGLLDSISMHDGPPEGAHVWPRPIRSDDQGRFTLSGIGRGVRSYFAVHDPRFAPQLLELQTNERDGRSEATLVLQSPRIVVGRVLDADSGQPVPGALVSLGGNRVSKFRADSQGRFQAYPPAADRYNPGDRFGINVFPPEGSSYLVPRMDVVWTKGAVERQLDIKLRRGVVIRGKVIEQGTGRRLAAATVEYLPINGPDDVQACREATVATRDDGSFQIVVSPGKGHLLVFGATPDYLLDVIGERMLTKGRPGGQRYYAHQIVPYEVKAGDSTHAITAVLRPGKTIKGRVIGPEGQVVTRAAIVTRIYIEPFNSFWRGDAGFQPHARDGRFELHGLDAEKPAPAYFLDADHEWGATLEASGKQAGADVTVRLQPCGRARARLVGPDGKPVAKESPWLEIIATPGPPESSREPNDWVALSADAAVMAAVAPKHYRLMQYPLTDTAGHVTLPALVPGALYRLSDRSDLGRGQRIRKEFTVKPGETLDLGDMLIEKPKAP